MLFIPLFTSHFSLFTDYYSLITFTALTPSPVSTVNIRLERMQVFAP